MHLLKVKFGLAVTNCCIIGLVHIYLLYKQNNKWKGQTNMKCYCVSVNDVLVIDRIYDVLLENTKNRLYGVSSFLVCLHFQDNTTAELRITQ